MESLKPDYSWIVENFNDRKEDMKAKGTLMCLSIRTPKTINFTFGTNRKLMVLDVPKLTTSIFICPNWKIDVFMCLNI